MLKGVASICWSDDRSSNKKSGISKWSLALIVGIGTLAAAGLGAAAIEEHRGSIAALRLYLIWDDNGQMSKDVSRERQVVATTPHHSSIQARVDVVIDGHKGAMGKDPLEVTVHSQSFEGETQDAKYKLPVGYFSENRMFRSIIVTHDCQPFEVNATLGNSHRTLKVDLTCGD
jgi:hypothetical protein